MERVSDWNICFGTVERQEGGRSFTLRDSAYREPTVLSRRGLPGENREYPVQLVRKKNDTECVLGSLIGLPAGLVRDAGLDGEAAQEDPDRGAQVAIEREGRE